MGAWTAATFLPDSSFGTFQMVFDADGTALVGSCTSTVDWAITDGGIRVVAPDDD